MIALKINNIKSLTSHLFIKESFDTFLLSEAEIITANKFHIDGFLNFAYFSEEEKEALSGNTYALWETVRPLCFQLIKGQKLPLMFKIILRLSASQTATLLEKNNLSLNPEETGLFFNIKYEKEQLTAITGTALSTFSLDKTIDVVWDTSIRKFLNHYDIEFEEL